MKAHDALFVTSAADARGFPAERLPELALVGRSNVGKSSLINALVRRSIARTSAEPGKTRLANVYRVTPTGAPAFHLVDLPGYGYARGARPERAPRAAASRPPGARGDAYEAQHPRAVVQQSAKARREDAARQFEALTTAYFSRVSGQGEAAARFAGALLLVDSRHPGLPADVQAWRWIESLDLPRAVVATKVDKLTRAEWHRHMNELGRIHDAPVTAVSAASGEGLEELWTKIAKLLLQPPPRRADLPIPSK